MGLKLFDAMVMHLIFESSAHSQVPFPNADVRSQTKINLHAETAVQVQVAAAFEVEEPVGVGTALAHHWQRTSVGAVSAKDVDQHSIILSF